MKTEAKILVAEDNVMNQLLIKHLLRSRGYKFDLVVNGAEAVETLKTQTYDLVLMDIMMPEMDGYEAMRQIRGKQRFKKLPIIALTAKAMKDDKQKCINAGANDYITKPVAVERLLSLMRVWLSK